MTRIQFFHNADDRVSAAADWLRRCWQQRQAVMVFAPTAAVAGRLDQLLWTQPATGFVPHCPATSALAAETPIVIAGSLDHLVHDKMLLNLDDATPPGFSRFETLVEIVSSSEDDRQAARGRFRYYRERGYAIDTTDLAATPW